MMLTQLKYLLLLVALLYCQQAFSESKLKASDIQIQSILSLNSDNQEQLSLEQIDGFTRENWQSVDMDCRCLEVNSGLNWFKVTLFNTNAFTTTGFLSLENRFEVSASALYRKAIMPNLSRVDFKLSNTNSWTGQFVIDSANEAVLYIQVLSDTKEVLSLHIESSANYHSRHMNQQYYYGFTVGGVLFVAMVFALLFVAVKDLSLVYLAGYFTCRAAILSVLLGGHLFYLMPDVADLRGFELPWLVVISAIFYLLFTNMLFQLNQSFPAIEKKLKIFAFVLAGYAPLSLILSVSANLFISGMIMITLMMILAGLGLFLHIHKKRLALLFFVVSSTQFLFTCAILIGFYFNVPFVKERELLHIASFVLNTLLIVFIVARQYYYILEDKQKAQKEALANARASEEANKSLLKIRSENEEELEQKVQARTLELNIALSELEELNQELEQINTIDELTGLYNRRFYDQRILAEYRRSKRNLTPLSLVIIDIDYFKKVNDNYGHLAGDQCLSWLAQHIKQSLKRSTDVGCRYGGEEFCLILPDTDLEGAMSLAQELRQAIETFDFVYQQQHLALTISCGVATYTQQENVDPIHIFEAADKALYKAKHSGRNQVQSLDITKEQITPELPHD